MSGERRADLAETFDGKKSNVQSLFIGDTFHVEASTASTIDVDGILGR